MRAEAEDRGGEARQFVDRGNAGMADAVGVLPRLEQRLGDEARQRGDVGALQHGDGLLAAQGRDQFRLGEGLQQLDRDDTDLLALAAQVGRDGLGVVGDRAEADHDLVRVVAQEGMDRLVDAPGQLCVLGHRLADEAGHGVDEVGAMVGRAGLEVGLVLHAAGQAGVVHIDQRRNALARALLERVEPLAAPLAVQFLGDPAERVADQRAVVVALDRLGRGIQVGAQFRQIRRREVGLMPRKVLPQLEDATLGAEQHVLRDGRGT